MKNVYILHGCCDKQEFEDLSIPTGSNFHWIPWLQKQLIVKGYNCQTPEMPRPYKPSYNLWKTIMGAFPVDHETPLLGHSCGGRFFLRLLSEMPCPLETLILVAPWLDPQNKLGDFLEFDLNPAITKHVKELHLLYSKDEPVEGVAETVALIKETCPEFHYHEFDDHGHFCLDEMKTEEFAFLRDLVEQ
jgi:hypothetical protein